MAVCKKCREHYPEKRKEMGYEVCIECSTVEKWSCVQIVHHKTGNETEIIKDPEVAAEFMAKSSRIGFGALRGMTSSYRERKSVPAKIKKETTDPVTSFYTVRSRRPMPLDFEGVGKRAMELLEEDYDKAIEYIETAEREYRLLPKQAEQLKSIFRMIESQTEYTSA